MGRSGDPSNTWFLGPTLVLKHLDQFSRFCRAHYSDRQTDHATWSVTIRRIYVGSMAMRPNNNNKAIIDIRLCPRTASMSSVTIRHVGVAFAWPTTDKHDVIHKTEVHNYNIALSSVTDWATATVNVQRKFREVWACRFWDIQADRHPDMLITILCTPSGGELTIIMPT